MQLTTGQKTTFKAWLTANTAGMDEQTAANLANAAASPGYFAWRTNADKASVDAQIDKAKYTPADAPPASPSTDMTYQNRALLCQLKQTNAQWLTVGTGGIDARLTGVRQNFKDCLMQIPSGASGVNQDAGWGPAATPGTVRTAMMRTVSNFEKLFVSVASGAGNVGGDARGVNTNPDLMGIGQDGLPIEGNVSAQFVSDIRAFA